eukprot:c1294_g1_i1.p1 GENE.c1294_g1_i1~~c1294_g1_i1.p1  ORF type:complete len:555 (+),score=149.37 c1294_g1_i1:106-1665(+)
MDIVFKWKQSEFTIPVSSLAMSYGDLKLQIQEKTGLPPARQIISGLDKRPRRNKRQSLKAKAGDEPNEEDKLTLAELGVVLKRGRELRCMLLGQLEEDTSRLNAELGALEAQQDAIQDFDQGDGVVASEPTQPTPNSLPQHQDQHQQRQHQHSPHTTPYQADDDPMNEYQMWNFHAASRVQGPNQTEIARLLEALGELGPDDMAQHFLADHPEVTHHSGSFATAVAAARQSFRLLIVVLHNPNSELSQSFVIEAFTSPLLLETLAGRFVVWVRPAPPPNDNGAVWLQDSSASLYLTQLPYVGICVCVGSQISIVDIMQGSVSSDELIVRLMTAAEVHGPSLDSEMARVANASTVSDLRTQQDMEYQQALEHEQLREAQLRQQEMEIEAERLRIAAEEEAQRERHVREVTESETRRQEQLILREEAVAKAREALLPEPALSDSSAVRLKIRCADGTSFERRFPASSCVQDVLNFLFCERVEVDGQSLVQSFPRRALSPSTALLAAGLHPSASLFLEKAKE